MEILDRNGEQSKRLRHRIQIVKGWLDAAGKRKTFDVAWSGDRKIGKNGSLPPVGTSLDLNTACARSWCRGYAVRPTASGSLKIRLRRRAQPIT